MPIRPENRARYPGDWPAISLEVRARAGFRCEGSPAYPDCRAANAEPHPVTGSKVVLTVGHLNHTPEDCGEPGNRPGLKAWCQRCHNTYDGPMRRAGIAARAFAAIGNGDLFTPTRVQLRRTKGWRMPPDTVKVSRPSLYGNPFIHPDPAQAVEAFRRWCEGGTQRFIMGPGGLQFAPNRHKDALHWSWPGLLRDQGLSALRGKHLACWCALDAPCHADVLLELANR